MDSDTGICYGSVNQIGRETASPSGSNIHHRLQNEICVGMDQTEHLRWGTPAKPNAASIDKQG